MTVLLTTEIFPPDNIWNTPITGLPVHASSATFITSMGTTNPLTFSQQFPTTIVDSTTPSVAIHLGTYASESDAGPSPIPPTAAVEANTDEHVIVIDNSGQTLYELFHAVLQGDNSWNADQQSIWNLTSNALRTNNWTSGDAAGLPIFAGLLRYDEAVTAGVIPHALRLVVCATNSPNLHTWPGRHDDGATSSNNPPYGSRLRLKAGTSTSGFSATELVIATALKTYGAMIADRDTPAQITLTSDVNAGWAGIDLSHLGALHVSDFEVVDASALMVSAGSGQAYGHLAVTLAGVGTLGGTPSLTTPLTYTRVQGATGSTGGSNAASCTVTAAAPTGSGHLLVAFVNIQGTASVTITPPTGWVQAGASQGYLTGNGTVALFYRPNSTAGVTAFAFAFSAPCNAAIAFEEWSGVASASPLDTSVAHQEGKVAAVTTGTTSALTGAWELALWGLGVGGVGTLSYSAVTNGYSTGASAHSSAATEAQATLFNNTGVGPAATSSGCTMSSTGATDHTTILAVFLPSGAGGSGVPLVARLAGVGTLSAQLAGQDIGVTTVMTGTSPYGEIMSEGSAGTAGAATLPAAPTGHGWVYQPGAGSVAPGDWQASITLKAADWGGDAAHTTLTFRAFLYSGGAYTPIGVWAPVGVTSTAKTTYAFPPTSFNSVTTGPDDLLYFDLWWQNTSAGGIAGDNPTVYVSTAGLAGDMQVGLPLFTPGVVVPPPPAGGPLSLTIGGQGTQVVGGSLTAKSMVGRRGELSATVYDPAGATHLQQYQQVALYDAMSALAFSGYITSPVETKPGLGPLLVTQFTATDQHYLAAKRIAAVVYRNQTTGFMVNDLWASILAMEGVTIGQIDPGITIPVVNFGYVPISDALDALALAASSAGVPHYWMIDQQKALWFVAYASVTGPTVDGTQIDGDGTRSGVVPSVTRANPLYRNTQYAVGGTQQTSSNDETRAGDGQTRTFPFSYALNDTPSLFTLNGAAKSLGVKGQSGFNYYYAVGDNTIVQDSSETILVSTDRLRMVYIGQVPAVFTAQNTAAVAQQAALDGTSGIVESVVTDTTIASLAQGTTVVGQLLTRYCLPGARFVFATQASGFAPGQLCTVDYPSLGFVGAQLLVEEVDLSDQQDGFQIWYTVTAVEGPYDTTWAEFFGNLGKPPAYNIAANISLGTALNSPLFPSTTLYPSPTLYPQD